MATAAPSRKTAPAATADRWAMFRSLLAEQRTECVRQCWLALVHAVASVPDPVAMAGSVASPQGPPESHPPFPQESPCIPLPISARPAPGSS